MKVATSKEIKTLMLKLNPEELNQLFTGGSVIFDTGKNQLFADKELQFLVIRPEKG